MANHDYAMQRHRFPRDRRIRVLPCLLVAAILQLSSGTSVAGAQTAPPGQSGDHGPGGRIRALDLAAWTVEQSGTGSARLRPSPDNPGVTVFRLDSNGPSTVSLRSPPLETKAPYRVTFWLQAPRMVYRGFTVYDARDAAGERTDIRIFVHTDRKAGRQSGGWHGALWVRDAKAAYSVAEVPRGKWLKIAVERRKKDEVALFVDDAPIGSFVARGVSTLAEIGDLGEDGPRGRHGSLFWGPAELSSPPAAWSSVAAEPTKAGRASRPPEKPEPRVALTEARVAPNIRNRFTPLTAWANVRNPTSRQVTARVEFRLAGRAEPVGSQVVAIAPGKTEQVVQPLGTLAAGPGGEPRTYRLTVTLAPEAAGAGAGPPAFPVSERSHDFAVGAPPDLTVASLKVTPNPLEHWGDALIEVEVANLGGEVEHFYVDVVAKWRDGKESVIEHFPAVTRKKSLVLKFKWRALRDRVAIVVRLDPQNEVAEADEENNVASQPIEVLPPQVQAVRSPPPERAAGDEAEVKFGAAWAFTSNEVFRFEKVAERPVIATEDPKPFSVPPVVVSAGGSAVKEVSNRAFRLVSKGAQGWLEFPWLAVVPGAGRGVQAGRVTVRGPTRILFDRPFENPPVVITSARHILPPGRKTAKVGPVQPVTSFARSPDRQGFEVVLSQPNREPDAEEAVVEFIAVDTRVATDFIGGIEVLPPDADKQLKTAVDFGGNFDNAPVILSSALYEESAVPSSALEIQATGANLRVKGPRDGPAGPALVQWLAYNGKDDFWVNRGECAFEWGEPGIAREAAIGTAEVLGDAEGGLRVWAFAKADAGANNDTKDIDEAAVKAKIYRRFRVTGQEGQDCIARVRFQAEYTGAVDLFGTGVTPIAGAAGNYRVEVVGRLEQTSPQRALLANRRLWKAQADLQEWAKEEIAIEAFEPVAEASKAARALTLALKALGYLRGHKNCDEEVADSHLVQFDDLKLRVGESYELSLVLQAEVKEVALGRSVGYTEVDFSGKTKPDNCNKTKPRLRDKGLRIPDAMVRLRPSP